MPVVSLSQRLAFMYHQFRLRRFLNWHHVRAVCILPEESAFGSCKWSTHFGERTHAQKAPLPGIQPKCESGPRRLVITLSINQRTNSLKAVFFFFFRSRPSLLFVASQCETVCRCAWWLYLSVLPGAFAAGATPVCLSSSCHQSCGVKLKRSWRRRTDRQTDRQWAAAVSGLDGLRQPTREPHADDAPSPPCNSEGLIRVLSITFQAKLILTFKPGWSPCTLSRPSEYFATGVGYKKQQYESTNKDKTDLQLKEHFVTFKRFFQLEIEWKMSV